MISLKENARTINIGRIIKSFEDTHFFDIKTYTKSDNKEYVLIHTHHRFIKRKATPEEIEKFEMIENSEKYNL
jgi:hypothetical protein